MIVPMADNRMLFDFFSGLSALQCEHHIIRTLKEAPALLPAHAAFAVLQPDKLLFHFSTAVRTYLAALSSAVHWGRGLGRIMLRLI